MISICAAGCAVPPPHRVSGQPGMSAASQIAVIRLVDLNENTSSGSSYVLFVSVQGSDPDSLVIQACNIGPHVIRPLSERSSWKRVFADSSAAWRARGKTFTEPVDRRWFMMAEMMWLKPDEVEIQVERYTVRYKLRAKWSKGHWKLDSRDYLMEQFPG
jgi:hypothetical protein